MLLEEAGTRTTAANSTSLSLRRKALWCKGYFIASDVKWEDKQKCKCIEGADTYILWRRKVFILVQVTRRTFMSPLWARKIKVNFLFHLSIRFINDRPVLLLFGNVISLPSLNEQIAIDRAAAKGEWDTHTHCLARLQFDSCKIAVKFNQASFIRHACQTLNKSVTWGSFHSLFLFLSFSLSSWPSTPSDRPT